MHEVRGVVFAEVVLQLLQRAPRVSGRTCSRRRSSRKLIEREKPEGQRRSQRGDQRREDERDRAFVVQSTKTAMPMANPRMAIGKISESSNHTQVPMKHCTKATNTIIAARMM